MSDVPPPYAAYPRQAPPAYGTADQLQAVMEAYHGFMPLFLLHLVMVLAVVGLAVVVGGDAGMIVLGLGLVAVIVAMYFLSYRLNRKIAFAANWSPAQPILASLLIAFSTVACGIWGYVIMQNIALSHIRKYGVKSGFFGMRKKDMKARIEELRAMEGGATAR